MTKRNVKRKISIFCVAPIGRTPRFGCRKAFRLDFLSLEYHAS